MVDRKRWEESLRKAREILRETPEVRARQRRAAERAEAEARERQARTVARMMIEREQALIAINKKLDELEDAVSWLTLGKGRKAR